MTTAETKFRADQNAAAAAVESMERRRTHRVDLGRQTARKQKDRPKAASPIRLVRQNLRSCHPSAPPGNQSAQRHYQAWKAGADDWPGDRACDRRREGGVPKIH
jgi:hypothetical protein